MAASFAGPDLVFGELEPEQAAQPRQVARQLHVPVDHLGVHVGIQHHSRPAAEDHVVLLHKDRDLVVKPLPVLRGRDELAQPGGEALCVADRARARVDRRPSGEDVALGRVRLRRHEPGQLGYPRPHEPRVAD